MARQAYRLNLGVLDACQFQVAAGRAGFPADMTLNLARFESFRNKKRLKEF